ncbi:leishmanolysin-related zinc metalloendopeptidase [Robiginitalea sp. IMCC43444]|uniref:leishmanolysin-related zinc metalloendopeptidase n=1 Tax=Robiginitalea sp. IMCC43444 TaxID=3459121 RepID=UPI00404357CE
MLLFTSCSEELAEDTTVVAAENQLTTVSLAHDGTDLIEIQDLTDSSPQVATSKATDAAGLDRGRFNISLKFILPPTERQKEVFDAAAARWERIIIGDVPSFTGVIPSAFRGFPPAVDGTLDDIVIEVALANIDGPGGILGQAGPRFIRLNDFLTLSGVMFFDIADLAFLEQLGLFEDVIVHEMGHVLGIGTLWNINFPPLNFQRNLLQGPPSSPYFAGQQANVFWNAEGGTGELPIENLGGPGTAFGHWKESTLNNELMTGFLNFGENPLSRITAGSMNDLGYKSASVGEQYDLPKDTPGVDLEDLEAARVGEGLNIAKMETLLQPVGYVTSSKKK